MAITRTDQLSRQSEHAAVIAHGAHPEYRLEFPAEVATDANATSIYQGSVVSLNEYGQYVLGCDKGSAANFPVPCISMKNVFDPDVATGKVADPENVEYTVTVDGNTQTKTVTFYNPRKSTFSAVGGIITAIPCTGSYEIETTEFVTGSTYHPNDALIVGSTAGVDLGKIDVAPATLKNPYAAGNASPVIGFVSKATFTVDAYQQKRISFWANFIPAAHS